MSWELMRLNDPASRVIDCWRACFHEDAWTRGMARWDWLMFVTGASMALGGGFALGYWVSFLISR